MDVKSENQTTVEVDEAPMLRDSDAAEVHTVSCIAYSRFADATLRETNIDDDDDDDYI